MVNDFKVDNIKKKIKVKLGKIIRTDSDILPS